MRRALARGGADEGQELLAEAFGRESQRVIRLSLLSNSATASRMAAALCSAKSRPVGAGASRPLTVSQAPPRPNAMTGVPHACASTGAMPKSSSAAKTNARARCRWSRRTSIDCCPSTVTLGGAAARMRASSGPPPITTSRRPRIPANACTTRSTRLYGTRRDAVT
jgi:hypothetical protein